MGKPARDKAGRLFRGRVGPPWQFRETARRERHPAVAPGNRKSTIANRKCLTEPVH